MFHVTAGQLEYASKQLLMAVHANTGGYDSSVVGSTGGMLISLDDLASSFWSDSAVGEQQNDSFLLFEKAFMHVWPRLPGLRP